MIQGRSDDRSAKAERAIAPEEIVAGSNARHHLLDARNTQHGVESIHRRILTDIGVWLNVEPEDHSVGHWEVAEHWHFTDSETHDELHRVDVQRAPQQEMDSGSPRAAVGLDDHGAVIRALELHVESPDLDAERLHSLHGRRGQVGRQRERSVSW